MDCFLEAGDRLERLVFPILAKMIPTPEHSIVSFRIVCLRLSGSRHLGARKFDCECLHDLADDLVLQGENIANRPVIPVGP